MDQLSIFILQQFCQEYNYTMRMMHLFGQGDGTFVEVAELTRRITILLLHALQISFRERNQANLQELAVLHSEIRALIRHRDAVFFGFAIHQGRSEAGDS